MYCGLHDNTLMILVFDTMILSSRKETVDLLITVYNINNTYIDVSTYE